MINKLKKIKFLKNVQRKLNAQNKKRQLLLLNKKAANIIKRKLTVGPISVLEIGNPNIRKDDGWVTADYYPGGDLCFDLLKPFPIPDNCINVVYSSHVLEHFSFKEILIILAEVQRVLIPGGLISVCVPDTQLFIDVYLGKKEIDRSLLYEPAIFGEAKINILNYVAYMNGEHHHLFDRESIVEVLRCANFVNPMLREFDPLFDLEKRRYESIYAIAQKKSR